MTTALPEWAQWLQALGPVTSSVLTVLIACFVAVISFRQWKTAHQKVMLDLFDRRIALFYKIIETVNPVMQRGAVRPENSEVQFGRAIRDARFLFGQDVNTYLEAFRSRLVEMGMAEAMLEGDRDRDIWIKKKYDILGTIDSFYVDFPALCDPYMRMDQRSVRTPWEWFLDKTGRGKKITPIEKPDRKK